MENRGAGTADQHADTDVYLVVYDDAYDAFFAERRTFMGRLGHLAWLEDFNGFGHDMVLFWGVAPSLAASRGLACPSTLEHAVLARLEQACSVRFERAGSPGMPDAGRS